MRRQPRRGLPSGVLCMALLCCACSPGGSSPASSAAHLETTKQPVSAPLPVAPAPATQATTSSSPPAAAAAVPTWTSIDLPEIDAELSAAIAGHKLPGAVIAIGHRDGLVFAKAYGSRALVPAPEPMTLDTIFDLASLTKPVATATLAMQLIERGKLKLDAKASDYLPELGAYGHGAITVRDLLVHSAGLPVEDPLTDYDAGREAALPKLYAQPQLMPAGRSFKYSDVGYLILGALIERVAGQPLDELAEQSLFAPLGMHDTRFNVPAALRARVAPTQIADDVRKRIDPDARVHSVIRGVVHDPRAFRMGGVAGNAGLFSTAADLARYARMLLGQGALDAAHVLQPASVEAMTAPVPLDNAVRALGWDMRSMYSGLRGTQLSHRAYGHGGFTGVSLWIDPSLDLFVIFLSNRVHPNGDGNVIQLAGRIADIAAKRVGRAPEPASCERLFGGVQLGVDVLRATDFAVLAGKRVALVVNAASRARDGTPTHDVFAAAKNVKLAVMFAPEHGLTSTHEGRIADSQDAHSGVPVYSLFGKTRKPTAEMLQGVDAIVFDLQDVGVRFFTYMSTLRQLLEAAAEQHVEVFVLDRPNPLGADIVEGPVLDRDKQTFVNFHPLPARHGMTAGELAQLVNAERHIGAKLSVVQMLGYARELSFAHTGIAWTAPSPNLRSAESALLYPAIGLLESSNISVGRGTDLPFAFVGAPWLRAQALLDVLSKASLPGVELKLLDLTPASDRYAGQLCHGIALHVSDERSFRAVHTGLTIAQALIATQSSAFAAADLGRLIGHAETLTALLTASDAASVERAGELDTMRFEARRRPYLLYPSCDAAISSAHAAP